MHLFVKNRSLIALCSNKSKCHRYSINPLDEARIIMTLFEEKRESKDRRHRNEGPVPGNRERRRSRNRRQTVISEISLSEWVKSLLHFQKRMATKKRTEEEVIEIAAPSVSDWTNAHHDEQKWTNPLGSRALWSIKKKRLSSFSWDCPWRRTSLSTPVPPTSSPMVATK